MPLRFSRNVMREPNTKSEDDCALPSSPRLLSVKEFRRRVQHSLKRKEDSSRFPSRRVAVSLRCRALPQCRSGILTRFPFAGTSFSQEISQKQSFESVCLPLRSDSPVSNRCSHGTFFHFSLQGFHLNSCYFHQDLH